jgi:flagellar biosynthesis/type III secretory pathway protein FliH
MTIEDLKDAVCDLVSIAEEYVDRKYFEELDNKGVAIIDALEELRELKEKATAIKSDGFSDHLLNMGYTKGMKDGYAKAIEEFAERIKQKYSCCSYISEMREECIDEIAKELKGE